MPKGNQILRGVVLNWTAMAISLGVAFFLSPFVVHHLGNVAYGVWTLVISMISYMGLLDLGLRGAVTRFVSRDHAQGQHIESSRAISAALWFRLWIGLVIVIISLGFSRLATSLFNIPPEMQHAASWAIVVLGAGSAVSLTFGVFGGVLGALHRFDLLSAVTISQTVFRALGTVWILRSGYGIGTLAVWEFSVIVVGNVALAALAFGVYPELRLFFRRPDASILRSLWGYSFYAFLINISIQIIYYTDNLVVGAFLSVGAVTSYAIGGGLIEYLRQLVASLTMTFTPLASSFDAQSQRDQLRCLLIQGTRAALLISLPIEVALFFRGHTFIGLWMGEQYAQVSGGILQILLLAQVFAIANYTSGGIAYGLGKHRPVAVWATAEAVANLVLSLILVRRFGLEGVAWGTVLSSLVVNLFFWPRYVCQIVNVPARHYLWQGWIRAGAPAIPFGIACYWADRFWVADSLVHFFLQIAGLMPVFLLGVAACFWKEMIWQWRSRTTWSASNA